MCDLILQTVLFSISLQTYKSPDLTLSYFSFHSHWYFQTDWYVLIFSDTRISHLLIILFLCNPIQLRFLIPMFLHNFLVNFLGNTIDISSALSIDIHSYFGFVFCTVINFLISSNAFSVSFLWFSHWWFLWFLLDLSFYSMHSH